MQVPSSYHASLQSGSFVVATYVQNTSLGVFPRNVSGHGGKALWFGVRDDNSVEGGRGGNELEQPAADANRSFVTRRSPRSKAPLVLMSLVAPIVGGPVGSVVAIVFGWAAHHEPEEMSSSRRRVLASVGVGMGLVFTCVWAAVIAHVAVSLEKRVRAVAGLPQIETEHFKSAEEVPVRVAPIDGGNTEPIRLVPTMTTAHHEGVVVVVDVGTMVPSLAEEMAKERFEAARAGDLMVVMTTRRECPSCRYFVDSLRHPLMQTALAHVRLVRIDVDVFDDDLSTMKIPHENLPGFFLLAPDMVPRDGIDGGEWAPDSVTNVAPVVGAFVRGKYANRRRTWQPVSENRLRL